MAEYVKDIGFSLLPSRRRGSADVVDPEVALQAELSDEERTKRIFVRRTLQTVVVLVIVTQRFIVPVGGTLFVAFPLIIAYGAIALLRFKGELRYDMIRTGLFMVGIALCTAAAYSGLWTVGSFSLGSLLLLIAMYIPWMFCVRAEHVDLFAPVARVFVRTMLVVAGLAIFQISSQLAGVWQYKDYLGEFVPEAFLAQNYNTSNPIEYGSAIFRSQAFINLEPSFTSQLCALAVVVALLMRAPAWQLLILGLGVASTVSGTGILLLIVGVILVLVRRPELVRPAYVIAGVLGMVAVLLTPAGSVLLERRGETTQQGTSGYMRFVQPYTEVARGMAEEPVRYLVGAGPGASERLLVSGRGNTIGDAVVYTIVPKLAFEYGLLAAFAFTAFLLVALFRHPPVRVLPGTIFFMIFFLSGSLLQAQTIVPAWLLTSLWARSRATRVASTDPALDSAGRPLAPDQRPLARR